MGDEDKLQNYQSIDLYLIFGAFLILSLSYFGLGAQVTGFAVGMQTGIGANEAPTSISIFSQYPQQEFLILLTAFLVIVMVGSVYTLSRIYRAEPQTQLGAFLHKGIEMGYTKDQLKEMLIKNKWKEDVIDLELKNF